VRPLAGGLEAWREAGLAVEGDDGETIRTQRPRGAPNVQPSELGDVEVLDESGRPVTLSSLWIDRRVALIFVRHFGCMLCRAFVTELQAQLHRSGHPTDDVVVIGNAEPSAIADFRAQQDIDLTVYVDPERHAYSALGFRDDVGGSANPRMILAAFDAWRRGARQGAMAGHPWQLGGVVIVEPSGEISFVHASRYAGDDPPIELILDRITARPDAAHGA
jgi:peroxiredoxin